MRTILHIIIGTFCTIQTVRSQVITFSIDRFQHISYPKYFSDINDALKKNSIEYQDAGTTEMDYFISIPDSILCYRYQSQSDTLRIVYYEKRTSGAIEVWTVNEGNKEIPLTNYLIGEDPSGNKLFICRWVDNEKIVGWFAPSIKCLVVTDRKQR